MGRLADKNILITGGNSGIGLAAAQEFYREGARVAICGLNEGSLQTARETLGAGSLAVRADVSNLTDLDTMFATIKREFGHLDGIFVNAGYSEFLLFEEVTEQSFDKVIAVNFTMSNLASQGARLESNGVIKMHGLQTYQDISRRALNWTKKPTTGW